MTDKTICRDDGRCEYAIQSGAEENGRCPNGKCAMPASAPGTGSDVLDCILGVGGFASFGPLDAQPAAHLTIPGALEWDGDNGTHGADGESCAHGESAAAIATLKSLGYTHNGGTHWKPPVGQKPDFDLIDSLRAQLANTEQSRRSFFDLSQDLEKRLAERDALLRSKSGDLIQYAARLLGAPLRELNGLIDEGARMTRPRVEAAVDFADSHMKDVAVQIRHIADALSAITKPAKPKACAACDGWGTISTGIDEAPSTNCKKCDGTGKVAP
jgi:hypothetical protein